MNLRRKMEGGVLGFIGFLLSPLSWWNDWFINIPLALGVAWIVSMLSSEWFTPAFIIAYWATNIAGLILMHIGIQRAVSESSEPYSGRALLRDVGISLVYTLVILVLIQLKILRPVADYFGSGWD
jgi:cellulose synthase/poly-beta-1,6-N-acetylglucosamine synthase-like glycosyltransferase